MKLSAPILAGKAVPPAAGGLLATLLLGLAGCVGAAGAPGGSRAPTAVYHVYVGAESADLLHRVSFGPDGARVERTIPVGELAVETEGPHGLRISPDGTHLYMTTGHGFPDGKLWKLRTGLDSVVAPPILLGRFPATLDLTPDGLYAFVANFDLHGEHVPSTVSVVFTPEMEEIAQIPTCVMPHGARMGPEGVHLYSACMMSDQLVEIDTRSFGVSRRFSVAVDAESPLPVEPAGAGHPHGEGHPGSAPTCSPTWAEPSPDGRFVYVACNAADRILEIDRDGWRVTRTFATGRGPYNLAASPDGLLLVATLKQGGAVEVFDLSEGRSLGRPASSTTVTHGVVVTPDSRYAFVSSEGVGAEPGRVDVYDLRSLERLADVEVGQQAGGIAFWRMEERP